MAKAAVLFVALLLVLMMPAPIISEIGPNHGLNSEQVQVTIAGEKFDKNTTFKLTRAGERDILLGDAKLVSKNQISGKFDLEGKKVGVWTVVATKTSRWRGIKTTALINGFTIEYPGPLLEKLEPAEGMVNNKIVLRVLGRYFRDGVRLKLAGQGMEIDMHHLQLVTATEIIGEADLMAAKPGVYELKATNDDGKTATLPQAFTVTIPSAPPGVVSTLPLREAGLRIDSIEPNFGFNNGKAFVTVSGKGFKNIRRVKLSNAGVAITGQALKVVSDQELTCFLDLHMLQVGKYDVVVVSDDGKAVLKEGFTVKNYVAAASEINRQLLPLFFDFDRFNLRANQMERIVSDLKTLQEHSGLYILLGGHADERGSELYNLNLSARRAQTIRDYLVQNGIDPTRIIIYAYGKKYPLGKGHNESEWALDRRVDVIVWEEEPTKEQGIIREINS